MKNKKLYFICKFFKMHKIVKTNGNCSIHNIRKNFTDTCIEWKGDV